MPADHAERWARAGLPAPRTVLVVGGGHAGHRCVTELRRLGFAGKVTLVGAEQHPPYDRTLLSKDNLAGEPVASLAPEGGHAALDVEVVLGARAVRLDPEHRLVGLADGRTLPYDRLVVATGGDPILPPALAAPGIRTLRTADDAAAVRGTLGHGRHVVVVGAGFIGGEIASAAVAGGAAVTLVEAATAPLEPVLGAEVGALVGELHRARGVDLRCGTAVAEITGTSGGYRVVLDGGGEIRCAAVVVGVGIRPQLGWLRQAGVAVDDGVLVDAACRTSVPGVLAAGDCARWWSERLGEHCRVEHWDTAGKHGAAAARTIVDRPAPFDPLPFFWSTHHDVTYRWAGHARGWNRVLIDGSPTDFTARYLRGDTLVGAFTANRPHELARLRRALLDTRPQEVTT